ncbi:CarD family transcriptional regulator [Corynebacterium bovis]|uniref:CarD family transcriptional regulator n=2 Tax=Corynebacterium bovis TaxID=36808 RepID=A0A3R8PIW1_9CORY|nr:CarD family transcriptional regulator [Corynebacterium bovis]MBB3115435.1 CarD family transcriptional regulator [Corynebacterium bovis DSM 20582 = CIP 54.80]MDH2456524.1 CarD family transcriptional regulator [Corynebacterium bovis]MDK8510016.1 CarD family transcriptional regulator [Corynebacterium bovis]MDN8578630.1 CarD family transcriptional regulator [Corynebacterium bovis]QQC48310.1 CarD family transcriptional regulator [Corynebacterium bovis]
MDFNVGDVVVYPHHGAAVIEGIEQREFKGETVDYLVLRINQGDLSVKVPAANAEKVGVRDVVGEEGLLKVFSVLRETDVEEAGNWSRRYKANQERLASGDVNKVAEVVRDLWRRDQDRGLSAGEKRMLAKARQVLVGELALAEGVDDAKADATLAQMRETIVRLREKAAAARAAGVEGEDGPTAVDLDVELGGDVDDLDED